MATQSQIDRYKSGDKNALSEAMQSDWDNMSAEGQSELISQSGDLWSGSAASGWEQKNKPIGILDPYAEIKKQQAALLAAQKQARINALNTQRQSALSSLEAERSTVAPAYLQQRGQLSTTAQQTARGAEQSLAARGLTRGGSAVQGDIARNVALQQGMTDIGTAEAGTLANIARRQTAAEQAYQQGLANAESETAATAAQNEIALLMKQQELKESKLAKQTEQDFEIKKLAQMFENDKQLQSIKEAADEARAKGDFERDKELTKYKNDLEKEQLKLKASTSRSGGGGNPKITEGQLNTLIDNFGTMVSNNPYYQSGGQIYQKKRLDTYLDMLGSKIQAGAIDPTTAQAMMRYVQNSPAYIKIYGNQPL